MRTKHLIIRATPEEKRDLLRFANRTGLSLSTIVRLALRKAMKDGLLGVKQKAKGGKA